MAARHGADGWQIRAPLTLGEPALGGVGRCDRAGRNMLPTRVVEGLRLAVGGPRLLLVRQHLHVLVEEACICACEYISLLQVLLLDVEEGFSVEVIIYQRVEVVLPRVSLCLSFGILVQPLEGLRPFGSERVATEESLDFDRALPLAGALHAVSLDFSDFLLVQHSAQVASHQ